MTLLTEPIADQCNCLALRQASRHVTQFYDRHLARAGLRTTQFSILAKLKRLGAMTINTLAQLMVMDRTTLGRTILPLQREGLIVVRRGETDRRRRGLHLTVAGAERLRLGAEAWAEAQAQFEAAFGSARAVHLRALLGTVTMSDLGPAAAPAR